MAEVQCPNCRVLQRRIDEHEVELTRLRELVAELQRGGKRQAAPFSKRPPRPKAVPPGRKSGDAHGRHGHRQPPAPDQVNECCEAQLPEGCPGCGGAIVETEVVEQYQTEIPRKPIVRRFNVHVGQCRSCGQRVQGRHPLQTSDALGAAASQIGPDAQAAAVLLNKELGLSHGKVIRCFQTLFGIDLSRGASAQIGQRVASRCEPVDQTIRAAARDSPIIVPDETGWRVGGRLAWLHAFVSPSATCYVIDPTRSGRVAEEVLGIDYSGVLIHDGWSPYDAFEGARHQQCLAHLLRRCDDLLATATRAAVRFPRAVADLLRSGLRLRDRFLDGLVGQRGLASARGQLWQRLMDLVRPLKTHPGNERFAHFLWTHRADLFTFLDEPGLDATNWRAEQAIRPAVVNRKVWGGNRTWIGARAQAILMSVFATCRQLGRDSLNFFSTALRARTAPTLIVAG